MHVWPVLRPQLIKFTDSLVPICRATGRHKAVLIFMIYVDVIYPKIYFVNLNFAKLSALIDVETPQ